MIDKLLAERDRLMRRIHDLKLTLWSGSLDDTPAELEAHTMHLDGLVLAVQGIIKKLRLLGSDK